MPAKVVDIGEYKRQKALGAKEVEDAGITTTNVFANSPMLTASDVCTNLFKHLPDQMKDLILNGEQKQ